MNSKSTFFKMKSGFRTDFPIFKGLRGRSLFILFAFFFASVSIQPGFGQSKIAWVTNGKGTVKTALLDGSLPETYVTDAKNPDGMVFANGSGKIFWVEGGSKKLRSANYDGTNIQDLATFTTLNPRGVTINESAGKLYIIGTAGFAICNLDGSDTVINLSSTVKGRQIAYNPVNERLYFTDQNASLKSTNLEGTDITNIHTGLSMSWGVKLNISTQKLFYSDRNGVYTSDLDGSNNSTIISFTPASNFSGIAVDERNGLLFWHQSLKIRRSTLTGQDTLTILSGITDAYDMTAMSGTTLQASNVLFSNTTSASTKIDWTNGNGTARAVFIKKGTSGTANPSNGESYTANTSFGSGTQIGTSGWYCVYNGTGTTVNVSGLDAETTYRVMVCEYAGNGATSDYNVSPGTLNPQNFTTVAGTVPSANLIYFTEKDGVHNINKDQMYFLYFKIPDCSKYDLSELGVNIDATSASGNLKMAVYDGNTKALLYQTSEIPVTGGVGQYVSFSVPAGSLSLTSGMYTVAIIANPSSGTIKVSAASSFVNQGDATQVSTASYAKISGIAYPTFPDPFVFDIAYYRAVSVVVKGVEQSPTVPVLTTKDTTAVTINSAMSGGIISDDGGAGITSRGICWNTTGSPTIADFRANAASNENDFDQMLTGLTVGTTYYVRAFATNCAGTGYGNEVSFTITGPPCESPQITQQPTAGTASAVVGDEVVMTVTAIGDGLSFQWKKGTVDVPNGQTPVLTLKNVQTTDAGKYTCEITGTCGNVTSNEVQLVVSELTPAIQSLRNIRSTANTTEINLVPAVSGNGTVFTVSPALPAGLTLDPVTGIISGKPQNIMAKVVYTLVATNAGGSVTTQFSIEVAPTAPTANASQAFCGSATISNLTATAASGTLLRWYDAAINGNLLNGTTPLTTATSYYAESWSQTVSVASLTRTAVAVTLNELIAMPVIVGNSTANNKIKLCPDDYLVCSNFNNTLDYQWRLNGVDIPGAKSNTYRVPSNGKGTYSLYVKNNTTGCDNVSADLVVDLYTVTIPVIYEKKKSEYISILIVDNTQNLYSSYLWTYADGSPLPADIVNNRQFLVLPPNSMSASYTVNITDNNACTASAMSKTVTLRNVVAKARPTVNDGNFTVDLTGGFEAVLTVKIFNQQGLLKHSYQFANVESQSAYEINPGDLQPGLYMVEITLGDYVQTQKIVVK